MLGINLARLARHRNIVFREFTRHLPNISEQEKNGLFDTFSRSYAQLVSLPQEELDYLVSAHDPIPTSSTILALSLPILAEESVIVISGIKLLS
ncbi:unnamed protein product [Rhizophagus irregularis]|nr:unnamed protein product [Rhizophagus irregularis]